MRRHFFFPLRKEKDRRVHMQRERETLRSLDAQLDTSGFDARDGRLYFGTIKPRFDCARAA